jgi:outer membrane lipoprotein-sorting protein
LLDEAILVCYIGGAGPPGRRNLYKRGRDSVILILAFTSALLAFSILPFLASAAGAAPAREPGAASGEDDKDAAPPARPSDPVLAKILDAFDRKQKETSTLEASFTERKELKLLAKPVMSRGQFFYTKPNQVRWEYVEPERKVFVITENMYVAYYPALKRAEEVPIKKFIGKRLFRFIGLGQSIDDLGKYYEIRLAPQSDIKETHLLLLSPRKKRIRDRVAEMKIWVDGATFLPRQLQYIESDGDSTLLAFQDIRVNVEVATNRFHIDLPKDVVVSDTFNGFSLGQQSF